MVCISKGLAWLATALLSVYAGTTLQVIIDEIKATAEAPPGLEKEVKHGTIIVISFWLGLCIATVLRLVIYLLTD